MCAGVACLPGCTGTSAVSGPGGALLRGSEPGWYLVAANLDNPRGVTVTPSGTVYIAESGTGGDGPCLEGPEGELCFGNSGAVTRVARGLQERVVTGLPSMAGTDGVEAVGPNKIASWGGSVYVTLGLGATAEIRDGVLGPAAADLGKLVRINPERGTWYPLADLSAFESAYDPDNGQPSATVDSNPFAVTAIPEGRVVTDAGGNDVLFVDNAGRVELLAVLPFEIIDAPEWMGLPEGTQIPVQPVPTSVAVAPDGGIYVGQLTGFPFVPGSASVFRVGAYGEVDPVVSGFTNIIDLAMGPDGTLYILEIATNGLLSGDPTGALWAWDHGNLTLVASDELVLPGAVAVGRDGSLYISNCTLCGAGQGWVTRLVQ